MVDETHFVNPTVTLCQFCQTCGPSICFSTQSVPQPPRDEDLSEGHLKSNPEECCRVISPDFSDESNPKECCRIMSPEKPCIVTHEPKNHRTYISTNTPALHDKDFAAVRDGLERAINDPCEAKDIIMTCNSRNGIRSTVISKVFTLKDNDADARGKVRKAWLLMILSDRFTAQQSIQFAQEYFTDIIRDLTTRASEMNTQLSRSPRGHSENNSRTLRSLGELLHFDDLDNYIHQKFTKILYELENKFQLLSVVPPGIVNNLQSVSPTPCFCKSSENSDRCTLRDRSETLVGYSPPCFNNILQVEEQLSDEDLRLVLQCILLGNRLVVRGQYRTTVESLIELLTRFIPAQCVRNFGYCNQWDPMCKFIGLPLACEVPTAGTILVLDVVESCRLELRKRPGLHVLRSPVSQIVEECFAFIKQSRTQRSDKTLAAALEAVKVKWSTKAIQCLVCTSDSDASEQEIMDILDVHSSDRPVIKFFMGCLKE